MKQSFIFQFATQEKWRLKLVNRLLFNITHQQVYMVLCIRLGHIKTWKELDTF